MPIELYYYSELGLDDFSVESFQRRDPFTNPEQFERLFARLEIKDWVEPVPEGRFQVTQRARTAARQIIQAGDQHLSNFKPRDGLNLVQLTRFLKQITMANGVEREPPTKWAISRRFRAADKESSSIAQLREYLMDIYAYRDDSHLSAARPHFNEAGIVWLVLGTLVSGKDINAQQIAEKMEFRGYEAFDYQIALDAAVEIGWAELTDTPGTYRATVKGCELHKQVEQLTDEYFYRPWSVMMADELDELYTQLTKLHDQLVDFKKMK
ncbi:MAG: hypothetical protein QM730_17075 [Anaerolineales bacterium]